MITVGELIHKLQQLDEDMQVSYRIAVYTDNEALVRNKKDIQAWLNQTLVSSRATYKRIRGWTWDHQMNLIESAKEYGKSYGCTFKSIDELESLNKIRDEYWKKKNEKESERVRIAHENAEVNEKEDWLKYTKLCQDVLKLHPEATSVFDQALVLIQHRWNRDEKEKLKKQFACMDVFRYAYDAGFGLWSNHIFKVLNLPVLPNGRTPDLIWYDVKKDSFVTSQNVEVEVKGLVNKLLDTVIAAGNAGDHALMETILKKNAGPYEIREFDWDNKSLRVGCHVFAWDNLVYLQKKYYGLEVERQQSIEESYNRLIQDCESTINKQMALISKYRAKLKLLKKKGSTDETN